MSDKDKLKSVLTELVKEVAEEAEEAEKLIASGLKPGTIVDRDKLTARKVPWTRDYMEKTYPAMTITPEETIPVTVNGIKYQLIADKPITVPSIVYDTYMEYRRAMRRSVSVIMTSAGPVNVSAGAGGLEPEPTREV